MTKTQINSKQKQRQQELSAFGRVLLKRWMDLWLILLYFLALFFICTGWVSGPSIVCLRENAQDVCWG